MSESDQILELERRLAAALKENDVLRVHISTGNDHTSNERYALAIAGTDCGIWERNFVTGEVYRSERLLEIMGYGPGDPLPGAERIDNVIHPDDVERRQIAMDQHFEARIPFDEEYRIRRSAGEYIWVHAKGHAVWDANGKPVRWAGSLSDVTERKKSEEALQESEQRFRALIENSALGIHISRIGGGRLFYNDTMARLLGYDSPQEIYDLPRFRMVAPHDRTKSDGYLSAAADFPDGFSQQYECDYVRKNGSFVSVDVIVSKIMWDGEEATQRTVIDLSERRKAEQASVESERRYRGIIENSGLGVHICRLSGRRLFINSTLAELLGYESADEIFDLKTYSLIAAHNREMAKDYTSAAGAFADGYSEQYECDYVRKDGSITPFHIIIRKIMWEGEDAIQRTVIDLSERRKAEQARVESEARFRDLIEGSELGIEIGSREKGRLFANLACANLFGYDSVDELLAVSLRRQIVAAGDRDRVRGYRESLYGGDTAVTTYEIDAVRKDGSIVPVQVFMRRILWEGEDAIQRTFVDLTERKQAEAALSESEVRLRAVIDHSPSLVYLKDTESRILLINAAYEQHYGVAQEEALGSEGYEWQEQAVVEMLKKNDQKVIAGGQPVESEFSHIDLTGKTTVINSIKFPVRDASGDIVGIGGIATDITERKKVEQDLRESQLKAEAANRLKSEFLATMSHEIRTPMHGILGTVSLMQDSDLSPRQRNHADTIKQSGDGLLSIINSILDLSKIEAGGLILESVNFRLAPLLDSVAGLMESRAQQKGLVFAIERAANVSDVLRGDPERIRQILFNLVGNSIKFTEAGGITIRVSQTSCVDDICEVRFEVADTGIGLEEEQQERVFDRFSQADGSTTRKFGGTGLGLAISRELAQLMGGSIGVRSKPGDGSVFWFTVCCESGDASNIPEPDQSSHADRAGEATQFESLRILIAEDNTVNQLIAADTLESAGHRVDVVSNGFEAIEAVTAFPYDLILMDIFMPEMDGLTATKRIRAMRGEVSSIPIIALTADAMVGEREKYLAAGMNDYLSKPFETQQLLRAIKHCIDRRTSATH